MLKASCLALGIVSGIVVAGAAQAPPPVAPVLPVVAPVLPPSRVVDLTTVDGMAVFGGQWKNMDAKIVEVPAMPTAGPAWKTAYDVQPKGGDGSFDDSSWPTIEPKGLLDRRGGGHLFMTWFRSNLTVPAKIGDFDTELVEDFFQAFAANALCNLHVLIHYGRNNHHLAEAIFKSVARALRQAVEVDPRMTGVPSTKGTLT